jgi:rubrerythrin
MSRSSKEYPKWFGVNSREIRENESYYYWVCEWCGYDMNEEPESRCQRCDAVRMESV